MFDRTSKQRHVNQVLDNLCCLHCPRVVTLSSGREEISTTWDHYWYAPDGEYGTALGAVSHDFCERIFFVHDFFFTRDFWSCPSILIFFFLYILLCNYVFDCSKWATTRITHLWYLTTILTRS
jgi:hypothetical protein